MRHWCKKREFWVKRTQTPDVFRGFCCCHVADVTKSHSSAALVSITESQEPERRSGAHEELLVETVWVLLLILQGFTNKWTHWPYLFCVHFTLNLLIVNCVYLSFTLISVLLVFNNLFCSCLHLNFTNCTFTKWFEFQFNTVV